MREIAAMLSPFFTAAGGGLLIGAAAALLLFSAGRVAGISGIVAGLVTPPSPSERGWRALFVLGLLGGGFVAQAISAGAIGRVTTSLPVLAVSGVLVGFGSRLAGGCTSGHGVCGVSRGSVRSIVATATFIAAGAAVVALHRVIGS